MVLKRPGAVPIAGDPLMNPRGVNATLEPPYMSSRG